MGFGFGEKSLGYVIMEAGMCGFVYFVLALALVAMVAVVVGVLALVHVVSGSVFNLALTVGTVLALVFGILMGLCDLIFP